MLITEYRVILPLTVEEYQVAQLYAVAEASKEQTGGGDGVEVLVNEPFTETVHPPESPLLDGSYTTGQFTHKIYHMATKLPTLVSKILPTSLMTFTELAWNAYPYCRTILANDYMKKDFEIKIESLHSSNLNLAHNLPQDLLAQRKIVYVDISSRAGLGANDCKPNEEPTTYVSVKTGRGPLPEGRWWEKEHNCPVMCAYKLVTCRFQWWGLQTQVENLIQRQENRIFTIFHRQLFCWTDRWYGLTMEDIRRLEEKTKEELEMQRRSSQVRGLKASD
nr:unnamed protein product [Spirometra erinaceieuropaei]